MTPPIFRNAGPVDLPYDVCVGEQSHGTWRRAAEDGVSDVACPECGRRHRVDGVAVGRAMIVRLACPCGLSRPCRLLPLPARRKGGVE